VSFDTLLTVVFVVVFIVLPLVSRVLRERNRPPTAQRGNTPPRTPEGTAPDRTAPPAEAELPAWLAEAQRRVREARERATAEASTRSGRPRSLVPDDPFETVAPADRQHPLVPEDANGSQPQVRPVGRSLVPDDPFGDDLVGTGGAQRSGAGLGREGAPPMMPSDGTRPESAVAAERRARAEASDRPQRPPRQERQRRPRPGREPSSAEAPAHRRRRGWRDGARLEGVGQLRFDREAIVSGLIWHEILDEPAWKRRRGRAPSRPRSR
jgi:hypothetical protein